MDVVFSILAGLAIVAGLKVLMVVYQSFDPEHCVSGDPNCRPDLRCTACCNRGDW